MISLHKKKALHSDKRGATVVEFGIVAPTFLMLLIGSFDLGHTVYMQSVLKGAVLESARLSTLESATSTLTSIDRLVENRVATITPSATVSFERKSYFEFTDIDRPEAFEDEADINGVKNGVYDPGECFSDENGNGQWDSDVGKEGIGGPNDIVLYTVTAEYQSLFPLYSMIGIDGKKTVVAETVLRNQPYGEEGSATVTRLCT
ncbi:TadE family protein [Sphingorhabdus sp. Alg239-R122]|uniref:TadE/TadG family type IV pilus assembly protein n=1 Tax=Sphingorhabdus sp. Alg239-R122 TaxID=2305989 RepID=UPI0013DA33FD|nr:TadE family protein [Sphingorhabdus sp. Alg239-R122]